MDFGVGLRRLCEARDGAREAEPGRASLPGRRRTSLGEVLELLEVGLQLGALEQDRVGHQDLHEPARVWFAVLAGCRAAGRHPA